MSLPVIGWKEILKALRKKGFYSTRQSGSHIIIENGQGLWTSVPRKDDWEKDYCYKLYMIVV
ncbi:MAG: type II toxin-antitoxin system HicA family toxin [Nitrosotalea sp.]